MPAAPLILTIDIGTSSARAILFDANAHVVEEMMEQRSYQMTTTPDGGAIFDTAAVMADMVGVVDDLLRRAGTLAGQIGAVAMDTLVGNVVGVDEQGKAVTPLFTYADTRNAAATQALRDELGVEGLKAAHQRTGCLLHTSYLPSRFCWLAEEQPQWFDAATRWVSLGEYIYFHLFGDWRVSYSVAAWTGLLNRHELSWDTELLKILPVKVEQLSPLGDLSAPCQGLQQEWAQRWPALANVPWLLPIGDGAAANIGSGCDAPDRIALTMGTTGAMRVVVGPELKRVPDGLWLYRVDAPRALLGGATTEGGNLFAWLTTLLQLPEADALEEALAARRPAQHGLTVLPFVQGERAPGWREDARAAISGLTLHTQPIDIVQAGLEAIAYRFALIYQRILPQLPRDVDHEIIAGGGALLSSAAWMQIMADVLGRPLHSLAEKEGTSRGLALLALEQLGSIPRPAALPPALGTTYWPDEKRHAVHQKALARQLDLYDRLLNR
jgi:gluconokinase